MSIYLDKYPIRQVANEIFQGFTYGFMLNYQGPRIGVVSNNLLSADQLQAQLEDKICKEIREGRVMGPFSHPPMPNIHISPIGLVPKSSGGWRMITHLSYPPSQGINFFIDPSTCSVKYTAFDTVVDMIAMLGPSAELGKVDIKNAFRLLPIHPGDFDLLGFKFKNQFYFDKCLPMGCSISCAIFEKFSTFLQWVVKEKAGLSTLEHYLDDFIFAGRKQTGECRTLMEIFKQTCDEFGIPLADDKTQGPVTSLIFLGLEIDTVQRCIRIPTSKILELKGLLKILIDRKKVKRKELESLVGKLNFFSKAVRGSRAFNRRFYDALIGVANPNFKIRISKAVREDMLMWLGFLDNFNGVTFFPQQEWVNSRVLQLYTDSAGSIGLGCGCFFQNSWMYFEWPLDWENEAVMRDITFLELVPIVLSVMTWARHFSSKKIQFYTDNIALVSIINTQSSRSKRIMSLLRELVLMLMQFNITFKAKHIPGIDNSVSDAISRKQWERFHRLAPLAKKDPEKIPLEFRRLILQVKHLDC